MSAAEGQEPPQVPHWMHISRRETPAVAALTSSKNRKFGFVSRGFTTCVVKGHLLWGDFQEKYKTRRRQLWDEKKCL
jgi:hypothetical protein